MTLRVNTIQDDVDAYEKAVEAFNEASMHLHDAGWCLRDRLLATGPVVAVRDGRPWLYKVSDSEGMVDRVRCTFAYSATKPDADTLDDAHAEMGVKPHGVNPDVRPVWPSAEDMLHDDADPTIRALAAHAALDELGDLEGEVA